MSVHCRLVCEPFISRECPGSAWIFRDEKAERVRFVSFDVVSDFQQRLSHRIRVAVLGLNDGCDGEHRYVPPLFCHRAGSKAREFFNEIGLQDFVWGQFFRDLPFLHDKNSIRERPNELKILLNQNKRNPIGAFEVI